MELHRDLGHHMLFVRNKEIGLVLPERQSQEAPHRHLRKC